MSWHTIAEAGRLGPSRRTWEKWINAGQVASYLDPSGKRMVWLARDDQAPVWAQLLSERLEELARDVARLRGTPGKTGSPGNEAPVVSTRDVSPAPAPLPPSGGVEAPGAAGWRTEFEQLVQLCGGVTPAAARLGFHTPEERVEVHRWRHAIRAPSSADQSLIKSALARLRAAA